MYFLELGKTKSRNLSLSHQPMDAFKEEDVLLEFAF